MKTNSFTPFSRSEIWAIQRNYFNRQGMEAWSKGQVPHYITSNPLIAFSYARIVWGYFQDLLKKDFDRSEPFYILELGAGCGRFAFYFIRQFFHALDNSPFSEVPVCYVMSDFAEANVREWSRHPQFKPWVERGRLDFSLFDAEKDAGFFLRHTKSDISPQSLKNPPALIANYVFDGLTQDLFFVENRRLVLGGLIVKDENGQPLNRDEIDNRKSYFEDLQFEYQRLETGDGYYSRPLWNQLLSECADKLVSSSLLFPGKTLNCLENLSRLSRSGYLLLAADRGSHIIRNLVMKRPPAITRHGSFSLLVNFYLIGRFLEELGATVKQFDRRDNGLNFLIALEGGRKRRDFWRTDAKIKEYMEDFSPDDFFSVKRAVEKRPSDLDLDQMLAYLQFSRWDYKFFLLFQKELSSRLPETSPEKKKVWANGIKRMLDSYLEIGESRDLYFEAGNLFSDMEYWGQAEKCYEKSLVQRGERAAIYFNLATCCWNLGKSGKTDLYLLKSLEIDPDDQEADVFWTKAREWRRRNEAFPLKPSLVEAASRLNGLVPGFEALGLKHVIRFHQLYQEPDIASLTRLPKLSALEDAGKWVKEQTNRPDRLLTAIMHPEHGFVGTICLKLGSKDALIWYWIGKERRNQGLATAALFCLREAVEHINMAQNIYAMVYKDNAASRRTLEKNGFQPINISFKAPHEELLAYCLGEKKPDQGHLTRINTLLKETETRTLRQSSGLSP